MKKLGSQSQGKKSPHQGSSTCGPWATCSPWALSVCSPPTCLFTVITLKAFSLRTTLFFLPQEAPSMAVFPHPFLTKNATATLFLLVSVVPSLGLIFHASILAILVALLASRAQIWYFYQPAFSLPLSMHYHAKAYTVLYMAIRKTKQLCGWIQEMSGLLLPKKKQWEKESKKPGISAKKGYKVFCILNISRGSTNQGSSKWLWRY